MKICVKRTITVDRNKLEQCIFIGFLFLLPFIFCVYRPFTLPDIGAYYYRYLEAISVGKAGYLEDTEYSFVVISRIAQFLFGSDSGFRGMLFLYEMFATVIMLIICYKSHIPLMAFAIYFSFAYYYQMNVQMRSSVANLLLLWSLYDIAEGKPKNFYIKVIIASLMHYSILVFLPLYPIGRIITKHRNKYFMFLLPIVAIILGLNFGRLLQVIFGVLGGLDSPLPFIRKLYVLTTWPQYSTAYVNPFNRISIALIFIYYFYYFYVKIESINNIDIICMLMASVSIFTYIYGANYFAIIAQRYPEIINLIFVILLVDTYYYINNKKMYLIIAFGYLALVAENYGTFNYIIQSIHNL